jgi:hypothetical protein
MPKGWRAAVTALARASRDAFLHHPWAMRALQGARLGPSGMRHVEQSMEAVADLPLSVPERLELLSVVDDYVFGHILRQTEVFPNGDARTARSMSDFMTAQLDTGEYPHLAAMLGGRDPLTVMIEAGTFMSATARFDSGLTAILDGFELRLKKPARRRGASRSDR